MLCFGCCVVLVTVDGCPLWVGKHTPAHHMMPGLDGWWAVGPMLASYEVVKMDNRSGRLFSECCLLCSFLLQVSTGPHDNARGGWVASRGPGAHFLRWCQDRGTSIMWQDKVGGFLYCIHAWALIQLRGSRCGVVTPLHRDGGVSTSMHVNAHKYTAIEVAICIE